MKIHHLALKVRDLESCAAFYRDILKLKEISRKFDSQNKLRSIWFALGESVLMIEKTDLTAQQVHSDSGWFVVALKIDPAEKAFWIRRLEQLHITIEHQTEYTLYFRDPEGNRVALSHYSEL